jgi:DNA-binding MarR family transcriptional regulator
MVPVLRGLQTFYGTIMTENVFDFTETAGLVIDKLVDAVGEPSASLTRVMTLIDIDEHPDTTQSEIQSRLDIDKSALSRNIDWLVNYGCVSKHFSPTDARENHLRISAYSKNHMDMALSHINNSHKYLQKFLQSLIKGFSNHKPTLRDAKILITVGSQDIVSKAEVLQNLYNGPVSTDTRAVQVLTEEGLIEKNG